MFCSYCLSCCVMKPVMSHVCLSMHSVIKLCSTLTSFHQSYSLEPTWLLQTCWSNIWMFILCRPQNKRLVLPVLWCSSHMARAALGNLTLLSTLINDDPTPQTPCRHLTIAAVKIQIVLTWQVNRQHFKQHAVLRKEHLHWKEGRSNECRQSNAVWKSRVTT